MHAGIRGDKASLTFLLDLLSTEGHLPGCEHYQRLKYASGFQVNFAFSAFTMIPQLTDTDVFFLSADLQMAVGIAFSSGRPSKNSFADDVFNFHRMQVLASAPDSDGNAPLFPRDAWSEEDESLLQAAILLWCHAGLTYQTDPPKGLDLAIGKHSARLMMLVGSYSGRPEAVDCFKSAGHDMSFYNRWVSSTLDTNVHFNCAWIKEDASDLPIALTMLAYGGVRAAARLLRLGAGPEARNILMQVTAYLRSSQETSITHKVIDNLSRQKYWLIDPQSVLGIAEFADVLHERAPSFQTQVAQTGWFGRLMKRRQWDLGVDIAPLLEALLQLKGHAGRPPMANVLANWLSHVHQENQELSYRSMSSSFIGSREKSNTESLQRLCCAALDDQNADFLARLDPFVFTKKQVVHGLDHVGMVKACLITDGISTHSNLGNLRETLEFLESQGLDYAGRVEILVDSEDDAILHWLSSSAKTAEEKIDMLNLLLSLGCDPDKLNKKGEKPSAALADSPVQERWDHAVRRFKAQQFALNALREIKQIALTATAR